MSGESTTAESTNHDSLSVIGPTVRLNGDLTGTEDLIIKGVVSGTIAHRNHVTIDPQGQINGSVLSRRLTIGGTVDGYLSAIEGVVVKNTANMHGHVSGASIMLDQGTNIADVILNGRIGLSPQN